VTFCGSRPLAAVLVAWWLDRRQLAVDYTDYNRLKAEEVATNRRIHKFLDQVNQFAAPESDAKVEPVPGDEDYRFPPTYPLHYGPSAPP
jgi:hypothetical protein